MTTGNEPEDNGKSKPVIVNKDADKWVVRNEDDSATLYQADQKEDAVKFANEMGEQHNIEVIIEEDRDDRRREERSDEREEEKEQKTERDIIVRYSDGKWTVSHEEDTAILYSSEDKDSAVKFAKEMAEEHEIGFKVERK